MSLFTISTQNGKRYAIHSNGRIQRLDMPFTPSDSWRLLGIEHVKRREFIPFDRISPEMVASLQLAYKNGKPQYTVRDLDHGTVRIWGNRLRSVTF